MDIGRRECFFFAEHLQRAEKPWGTRHSDSLSGHFNGFSGAIVTFFPQIEQQLCLIHQIRNSTKYVPYKDVKAVMADLKLVYGAPSLDDAEYRLEEFREKWEKKYPQILKSWQANWGELSTYFKYPEEVRQLIYTTNAVEGFHRMLRKYTKTKTIYLTDDAVRKPVFLSIQEITANVN